MRNELASWGELHDFGRLLRVCIYRITIRRDKVSGPSEQEREWSVQVLLILEDYVALTVALFDLGRVHDHETALSKRLSDDVPGRRRSF